MPVIIVRLTRHADGGVVDDAAQVAADGVVGVGGGGGGGEAGGGGQGAAVGEVAHDVKHRTEDEGAAGDQVEYQRPRVDEQ